MQSPWQLLPAHLDEVPAAQDGACWRDASIDGEHVARQGRHTQLHAQLARCHAHSKLAGVNAILRTWVEVCVRDCVCV